MFNPAMKGMQIIQANRFYDNRGYFCETYKKSKFPVDVEFVQDNHSKSDYGVIRGLHFQWNPMMGKLMRVTRGVAQLVAVDIRKESSSFGDYHSMILSADEGIMIYAPAGFARGFLSLENGTEVQYKCTGEYTKDGSEGAINLFDKDLNIQWAIKTGHIVSDKDMAAHSFASYVSWPTRLFTMEQL